MGDKYLLKIFPYQVLEPIFDKAHFHDQLYINDHLYPNYLDIMKKHVINQL